MDERTKTDTDRARWFHCRRCGFGVQLAIGTGSVTCPVCSVIDGAGYAGHPADNDHLRDGASRRLGDAAQYGRSYYPVEGTNPNTGVLSLAARVAMAQMDARWPAAGTDAEGRALAFALDNGLSWYVADIAEGWQWRARDAG